MICVATSLLLHLYLKLSPAKRITFFFKKIFTWDSRGDMWYNLANPNVIFPTQQWLSDWLRKAHETNQRQRDSVLGFLLGLVREDTLLSHKPKRKGLSEEVEPRDEREIKSQ